jgi:beta-N-acetylhexosaminidase
MTTPHLSPQRPTRKRSRVINRKFARLAVLCLLLLLVIRAGLTSATFMAPGGFILGWSQVSQTQCVLCQVPAAPSRAGHPLTASDYAAFLTEHLTLDQALGQLLLGQFAGQDATPEVIQMLTAQDLGGIILYASNISSASQIKALNAQLTHLAALPPLITVDQEGGTVNRLLDLVGPVPAAADLADPAMARARGIQDAGWLQEFGFNFNLAPVVDVGTSNPQLAGRTFGTTPDRVAAMASAYLEGLQASGQVTGCLKHFPGLGDTAVDPHLGLPTLNRSRTDLEHIDMEPYRLLLKTDDVRAIMVSHEMIPSIDPELPTSLSPAVINGLLRGDLGYNGVVITDSLSMDAISARWSIPDAALLSLEAGSDIITGLDSPQVVEQTLEALKNALAAGQLTRGRIDTSVKRILTLKIQMGLIPLPRQSSGPSTPTPHTMRLDPLQIGRQTPWN